MKPSENKHIHMNADWYQICPSEAKWILVKPIEAKCNQVKPSEANWIQVEQSEPIESKSDCVITIKIAWIKARSIETKVN